MYKLFKYLFVLGDMTAVDLASDLQLACLPEHEKVLSCRSHLAIAELFFFCFDELIISIL